jgi:hypothetical protein
MDNNIAEKLEKGEQLNKTETQYVISTMLPACTKYNNAN